MLFRIILEVKNAIKPAFATYDPVSTYLTSSSSIIYGGITYSLVDSFRILTKLSSASRILGSITFIYNLSLGICTEIFFGCSKFNYMNIFVC